MDRHQRTNPEAPMLSKIVPFLITVAAVFVGAKLAAKIRLPFLG